MSLTKVSYSMIEGATINVLDFGAVADGVADDTAAIQAAIAYTLANGYRTLYFPAGTYKTSASLTIAVQGFDLIGDGALSTKIKPTSALTSPCIQMGNGSSTPRPSGNMVISGLFLDGVNTVNTNADGLYMFCSHLEVRDCIISEFAGHGVNAFDSYSNKITHCRIYKCGKNGVNLVQAANIFEVSWNYILENDNYGIYASGGNSLVLYGNNLENNQYNPIRLIGNGTSAMRNVTLNNNYFENNSVDPGFPDGIYVNYGVGEITGLLVENNYFEGNGTINIQDINTAIVKNNVNGTLKVNFTGYNIFTENQLLGNYDVTGNNGQLSAYTNHNGTDGYTIEGRCTGLRVFTKEAGVQSTVFSAKRAFPGDIARGFIDGYWQMTAISPASTVNNSLFVDVLTGKLSFKDAGGTIYALY
jgi:hypothetical protein